MADEETPRKPPSSAPAPETEDWRDLAAKAAEEKDPKKMLELVSELCDKLDQREAARKSARQPKK